MKTTFSRTLFPAAIILLAALLLVGISFQLLVRNFLQENTLDDLQKDSIAIAEVAAAYAANENLSPKDFLINLSVAAQVSGADAVICGKDGTLLLCSDSPLGCKHQGLSINREYLAQVEDNGYARGVATIHQLYDDTRFVVATPILDKSTGNSLGIVIVSSPVSQITALLEKLSDFYLVVSVLAVLLAVVIMTAFAKKHSSPLRDMAKAAYAFEHGDLKARVRASETDPEEVQELALAFNNMAASLEKSEYQRKEFVANVSHELKTPMTTISGLVDGMLDGTIPPEKQNHYMQIVSDETKRLSRLVRSMLDISQLQDSGGIPEENKTLFDICECAGRVLITFEQKITQKGIQVQVDMPEHGVYTLANQDYITQVIYNLVDNGVKFCHSGGTLALHIREGIDKLYITIANDGQTIPPKELPLVFDRFHKLDKSRSQNRDGWGLGLYIVKTIVCSHGEDISVSSADGRTEFTFTLPLVN